jgi:hypothetical protein
MPSFFDSAPSFIKFCVFLSTDIDEGSPRIFLQRGTTMTSSRWIPITVALICLAVHIEGGLHFHPYADRMISKRASAAFLVKGGESRGSKDPSATGRETSSVPHPISAKTAQLCQYFKGLFRVVCLSVAHSTLALITGAKFLCRQRHRCETTSDCLRFVRDNVGRIYVSLIKRTSWSR